MRKEAGSVRKCEAEIHHSKCNGYADSLDHFTPRCILKYFRIDPFADETNLIPMNRLCHGLKDASTPRRKKLLEKIMNGGGNTLNEYREFRNQYDLVFVPPNDGD